MVVRGGSDAQLAGAGNAPVLKLATDPWPLFRRTGRRRAGKRVCLDIGTETSKRIHIYLPGQDGSGHRKKIIKTEKVSLAEYN